ncbi:MAG: nuclear transport factor 2 family protein [Desulfomonilaceae bacterium]|nr:nuclear transport factor 2 family protein [Desulfomonilaceae bacterium]
MTAVISNLSRLHLCLAFAGLLGLSSLFWSTVEDPNKALETFSRLFLTQDAAGITQIIHPDIRSGKEIRTEDVEQFLERCRSSELSLRSMTIDDRFKSEDGSSERIMSTFTFHGPAPTDEFRGPGTFTMVLLWVLEDGKWWLERPMSMEYVLESTAVFPTPRQEELALRFETALAVLDRIGLESPSSGSLGTRQTTGSAVSEFKELEKLHPKERGPKGVHGTAYGVQVLLRAASRPTAGLGELYHGDFKAGPSDNRRPVPWDMFRDYARAAISYGKTLEQRGSRAKAEGVYRKVISLGRRFIEESSGYQYYLWGLTFEKLGAEELARVLPANASSEKRAAQDLANLASRRIDLLQTAINCLDDLVDYNSLKAAITAAGGTGKGRFSEWGINTLTILAEKGAPARPSVVQSAGVAVMVRNSGMQRIASDALQQLASRSPSEVKSFIEYQRRWVKEHRVYGTVQSFR